MHRLRQASLLDMAARSERCAGHAAQADETERRVCLLVAPMFLLPRRQESVEAVASAAETAREVMVTDREVWEALETIRLFIRESGFEIDPDDSFREIRERVIGYGHIGKHDMSTPIPYPGDDKGE